MLEQAPYCFHAIELITMDRGTDKQAWARFFSMNDVYRYGHRGMRVQTGDGNLYRSPLARLNDLASKFECL
jgi:hypothetical protein